MRACMDENGMKFDEGEVDELTRALFHDAVALTRRLSQQTQQERQQHELEGQVLALGSHLASQVLSMSENNSSSWQTFLFKHSYFLRINLRTLGLHLSNE